MAGHDEEIRVENAYIRRIVGKTRAQNRTCVNYSNERKIAFISIQQYGTFRANHKIINK